MPKLFIPPAPPPAWRTYTVAGFIDALTRVEAVGLLTAAKTDPVLEMWMELAKARGSIDFNDASTREAAAYLVDDAALFSAERLQELMENG